MARQLPRKNWADLADHERLHLLWMAMCDLEQARQASHLAIELQTHESVRGKLMFRAISDITVVRYARAFVTCHVDALNFSAKINPTEFISAFTSEEFLVHNMFISLRNSITAHSDARYRKLTISKLSKPTGEVIWLSRTTHTFPSGEELQRVDSMVKKIEEFADPIVVRLAADDEIRRRCGAQLVEVANFAGADELLPFGSLEQ